MPRHGGTALVSTHSFRDTAAVVSILNHVGCEVQWQRQRAACTYPSTSPNHPLPILDSSSPGLSMCSISSVLIAGVATFGRPVPLDDGGWCRWCGISADGDTGVDGVDCRKRWNAEAAVSKLQGLHLDAAQRL